MTRKTLFCSAAAILPGLLAVSPAYAADAAAAEDSATNSIEEIVVTAQKRSESVQKVPSAITAVTGDMLQQRGLTQPSDLQQIIPNLSGGTLRGDTALAIRGVGLTVVGSSPGVAIHIDGIYQPRPSMGDLAQVDIARVEVLRGPQGTLYGRNANGGVINFITQGPTKELSGYAMASYQSYDEYRIQGAVNVPITDSIRIRFTGDRWGRGEGFVKNVRPGGQDLDKGNSWLGRIHLEADVTPELRASVIATFAKREGPFVYFTNTSAPLAESVTLNPALAGAIATPNPRTTAQNDPADQRRRYTSVAGILEWNSGDVGVKSITAFQRFRDDFEGDFDATNLSMAPRSERQLAKTFTQELTVNVDTGPIRAVVGGFYMHDNFRSRLDFAFPNGAANLAPPGVPAQRLPPGAGLFAEGNPYVTKTIAVFGDFTYNITEQLRLIGGLRYSNDKQRITQNNAVFVPTPGGPVFVPPSICRASSQLEFNSTTPRAGLQYDVSENSNVYATYSKGFKIGGFNYRTGCGASYKPEKLTAYEIGSKNRLLDGSLTVNASAFYYDYRDLQVEQLVGFAFLLFNAPKARIYGIELETVYRVDDNLTLNANASVMNARFQQFSNLDILNRTGTTQNLSGNPMPNAPDFSGNVGFAYETDPVIAGGKLTFRGDLSYKSRIQFREFNANADSQAGYALVNASLEWRSENDRYSVRVFGKNLSGQDYYAQLAQSSLTGSRFVSWGAPRQIGVELRTTF